MPAKSAVLYTPEKYYRSYRIQIAAKISGQQLTVDHKTNHNRNESTGCYLSFKQGDTELFEANAIAYQVGNEQLRGGGNEASVVQWCSWSDMVIVPAMSVWVYPCLGVSQSNRNQTDKARDTIAQALKKLNQHLATKTYLVGERLTQADITVACNLMLLFENVLTAEVRNNNPHVTRWYTTIMNQPSTLEVIGHPPKLAETEAQPDSKRFQELHQNKSGGNHHSNNRGPRKQSGNYNAKQRKNSGRKDSAGDQKSQKTEKKPAVTPPPAAVEEVETPVVKKKDVLGSLPKGTFDVDEWKRTYSNNDIATVAMPWLFENFDRENYSVWTCDYKYNDELSMVFMSCNLIGGMFQRLDKLRKFAFGSMCIFGDNNKNSISGVWLWRGKELAFTLDEDIQLDYEYYTWKKVDIDDAATRKMITEYFLQEGDFDGKKFNQGKIYK